MYKKRYDCYEFVQCLPPGERLSQTETSRKRKHEVISANDRFPEHASAGNGYHYGPLLSDSLRQLKAIF